MCRTYFQIKPDPPREQWKPVKMTVKINSVNDLWRVCLKSKYARIELPELEFEISQDGKRHVDSIYNHIASAVYNLGHYVQQPGEDSATIIRTRSWTRWVSLWRYRQR